MGNWLGSSGGISVEVSTVEDKTIAGLPVGFKRSAGRTPNAKAAASDAGRLAVNEEIIFLRNL